jgi:hypothetical protein
MDPDETLLQPAAAPAAPKKSIGARVTTGIAAHPGVALAVIVVLVVVLVYLFVTTRPKGWFRSLGGGKRRKKKSGAAAADAENPDDDGDDPEIDDLVADINGE